MRILILVMEKIFGIFMPVTVFIKKNVSLNWQSIFFVIEVSEENLFYQI